jgi:hypothetical protein
MDFTLQKYSELLQILNIRGYNFIPVKNTPALFEQTQKLVILRHDVDLHPDRSETTAMIEAELGLWGTYYFRIVPESWDEDIIKTIAGLGHEIGYHYEDLSLLAYEIQKNTLPLDRFMELAIQCFIENLNKLRSLAPIKTICMHGSPLSKWDSRLLWKYFDYKDLELEKEPYFDLNFENILYLTDTGRRWNGTSVSIRDKAVLPKHLNESTIDPGEINQEDHYHDWRVKPVKGSAMNMTQNAVDLQKIYNFRSTNDLISAAKRNDLPDNILFTFHPQRWNDRSILWVKELVWQNIKNIAKYSLNKINQA